MRCGKASRSPTGPTLRVMIAVLWDSWGRWAGLAAAEGGAGGDVRGYGNVVVGAEGCAGAGGCAAMWGGA